MSKKVQHPPKPKEFHASHFGQLKGLAVADTVPVQPAPPVARKAAETVDGGLNLFLQAVADVKPIHKQSTKAARQDPQAFRPKTAGIKKESSPTRDVVDEFFLQEISSLRLDTKFADSVPDDGEMKLLSGNRLRQVKRSVVSVEYQLDLHGLTREEALNALPGFLRSARHKGQKAVLVITGKGNHSVEEPVLRQAVTSWLRKVGRDHVLEFAPAPREMGGYGAFVVFLRPELISS